MTYKLVITKIEPNPRYDAEKANQRRMYNYDRDLSIENPNMESTVLQVELTEEEYKAFKKSALEIK